MIVWAMFNTNKMAQSSLLVLYYRSIVRHVGQKRQSSSDEIEVKPKKMRKNGEKVIPFVILLYQFTYLLSKLCCVIVHNQ